MEDFKVKHTDKAIMLSVLKELQKGKSPCSNDYKTAPEDFMIIVRELVNNGLISGFYEMDSCSGDNPQLLSQSKVTQKGDEFLSENSLLLKGYKEVKDWFSIFASITQSIKQ